MALRTVRLFVYAFLTLAGLAWVGCDSSDPGNEEEPDPLPFADEVVGAWQVTQVEDGSGTTPIGAGAILYAFERMAFTQYPYDARNDCYLRLRYRVDTLRAGHKLSVYEPTDAPADTQLVEATSQGDALEMVYYDPETPSTRNFTLAMEPRSFSEDTLTACDASNLRGQPRDLRPR